MVEQGCTGRGQAESGSRTDHPLDEGSLESGWRPGAKGFRCERRCHSVVEIVIPESNGWERGEEFPQVSSPRELERGLRLGLAPRTGIPHRSAPLPFTPNPPHDTSFSPLGPAANRPLSRSGAT